jgi:hypothetical protein
LTTSAPKSASVWVHQGPANTRDKSKILMPSSEFINLFCLKRTEQDLAKRCEQRGKSAQATSEKQEHLHQG